MNKKIALVTHVLDYVGPPAVKALVESGYDVIAHDPAFQDSSQKAEYMAAHPGTIPSGIQEPEALIQHAWDHRKKIDVIVSNDTFPAIHVPIDEATWQI